MTRTEQVYDIAVIGLGYVGLPLVVEASRAGMRVLGFDLDAAKVAALAEGTSYVEDIGDADVAAALDAGFVPMARPSELALADAVVICVPTPLTDHYPDLAAVEAAARSVGEHLRRGQLVVLESTSYPGTTEDVVRPMLEELSGLVVGSEFQLAYSPERIDPRNPDFGLRNTPKIVGGIDAVSAARAVALYSRICDDVVVLSGTREAEMAKLLENTYRQVNIALVNELAIFCRELGIDIWEAIRGASTKPFGFEAFHPGPGVGGHCIPIDPSYLTYTVRQLGYQFRLVESAQDINARMPAYVVSRITELLNRHGEAVNASRIHLIGVAYKPGVSDLRASPAVDIARRLVAHGAIVTYSDPHVAAMAVDGEPIERLEDVTAALGMAKIGVLITPHPEFDLAEIAKSADILFDTRGVLPFGTAERL